MIAPTLTFRAKYRYPSGFVLDASFETDAAVTALVGPSGSGKTTILSLVAGILRPEEGHIALGERTLVDTSRKAWLPPQQRSIGYVFQANRLFPHRTVRENLTYGAKRSRRNGFALERVLEVLELAPLLDRRPVTLSGGEARRVALGRALLASPQLLVLDEPLTGLDDERRARIVEFLERCLEEWRVPTLLVSHDARNVEALAERVCLVREGRMLDGD